MGDDLCVLDATVLEGKQIQGMSNIEHGLIAPWATPMLGDALITNDDTQLLVEDLDDGIMVRPPARDGIAICLDNHLREFVSTRGAAHARCGQNRGQRSQFRSFTREPLADDLLMRGRASSIVANAKLQ